MTTNKPLLVAFLASALLASSTAVADSARNGALALPANRIVGLWLTQGAVRPCGSDAAFGTVRNTLLFHAGGTVVENSRFSPNGVANANGIAGTHVRTPGYGTWNFDPVTGGHTLHLRFDWYVNGAYHGYATVDRQFRLSSDGMLADGEVTSTRFAADGSVIAAVCGTAVSDRI